MKYHGFKMVTALAVLFLLPVSGRADDLSPDARISEVTVYPGSALVVRESKLNLSAGEHSVILKDIKQDIDENTLTVSGKGVAEVKIYGAYMKKEYLTAVPDARVQEMKSALQDVEDRIVVQQRKQQTLQKEREFLNSIQLFSSGQVPKDLVTTMPSADYLDSTLKFLKGQYADLEQDEEDARKELRALGLEQERLKQELNQMGRQDKKLQRSVVVDISCSKPGTFSLDVAYLVPGAQWWSVYDARAEDAKGEVELTAYGVIKQTTGDDWEDVRLTLSTSRPTRSGRMPYVEPWLLNGYVPQKVRQRMALGAGMDKSMDTAVQYEAYELARSPAPQEVDAGLALADVAAKGLSLTYKIPRSVTIKSDGAENKFPVSAQTLKADFQYSAYPRAVPLAYLGSRVVNAPDLQLLAGPVNLFLEGEFVGKSSIDNIGPGEEFDLYLGVDENVKVSRQQISKKMDDVLIAGIPSPTRKTTFEYKLTIENYKGKDAKVLLFESMPVSQNDKIKVTVFNVSAKPAQKDWKDRKGVWLWELYLKPKEKREIIYTFSVESPRDMPVPGI